MTRVQIDVLTIVGMAVCGSIVLAVLAILNGCAGAAAHAPNVAEGALQAAELTECRARGREAKKDGGGEAYMRAYEECALGVDRRHGLDGGP